jgi:putative CocE/NonD family hydrolase
MSLSEGQLVAADQAPLADREDVLVYRSAPLSEDLTVVGRPEIRLWLASDRPDTDIFVRLIEESEDRPTINLSQGVVRTRYREGFDEEVMLEPGARTEFAIRLMPVGFRFVAGSRIRVDVTSSDFPAFDRNHNTGAPFHTDTELLVASQTVFHDSDHPSVLVLPVLAD